MFASCVGYFGRAYYGFYVTSSRMLVLLEGNKIWQLWNSLSVQIQSIYIGWTLCIINSSMWRGDQWSCIARLTLHHTRTAILLSTAVAHEPSDIILTFPSPSNVWRHWRHSRSQISHEPSDILLTCTWTVGHSCNLYVGLDGPGWPYVLGITPRGDVRLWTPRVRAMDLSQGQTCAPVSGRAPCVPRSREHEKRPAAGREKNVQVPKKHVYTMSNSSKYIYT